MASLILVQTCLWILVYLVLRYLNRTDVPKIKGLPEPRGWPIFGNLFALGQNHPKAMWEMSKKLGPVLQVRMGNRRIVVANTYDSVRELWIKNQSALISRPMLYTFHNVVSTSQGFTIGTSPWDESCKQRRKAAATALNRPAVQSYMPIVDLEAMEAISMILQDSNKGENSINIIPHLQRYALNTSLTLNYGCRISTKNDNLLKEIVETESEISKFRSTSNNWQDYVPLLRLIPAKTNKAVYYREKRDSYLGRMLEDLKAEIANGTDKPCITGNVLKDPDTKLNEAEIKSICLTMVSAGLDTVPATLIMGLGYLSSPHGQQIQQKAFDEITKVYPEGDVWGKCLLEEKIPYVTALYKETLRFFTVIRVCLPRKSIKDITYWGAVIPAGTLFYMNALAADYDETHFDEPDKFIPERYLGDSEVGTPHYAYGAGSRMCAGSHLGNRELYTMFVRLILSFQILPPSNPADQAATDAWNADSCPTALVAVPKDFKCRFLPRDEKKIHYWLSKSADRTRHL